eukprot:XP_010660514.2 PREDICTED: LOW QUALITY PROTEIN: probable endo-1,3(4)-beta-glucanase ARB_01444 [Vitis vinifera]
MAQNQNQLSSPFLFPRTNSSVLPDPSLFFSPDLLSTPLPTNSFFQNFVLQNGDQPEFIHPYLIKSSSSSLSLTYASHFSNSVFTHQIFNADLTISASDKTHADSQRRHIVSSFSDLSVTLDLPSSNLRFFLVRGSPFLTCAVSAHTALSITEFIRWYMDTILYYYGKLIARGARLALIAEEVSFLDVIPAIRNFLKNTITPWLDGSFGGNGFLYDGMWGGLVTKQGSTESGADFGFGVYNDHHFHLGYFLYAIAVLAKIDPAWGRKYRPQAYSLMADVMNLGRNSNSNYTRLRCFDLWKLHSWASGVTESSGGRNQESTSEAVNTYYSAALMGLAYGDAPLVATGSTLAAMEIEAAQTWWHVREGDKMYAEDFTRENRVVGILWANKRDGGLWFAPPEWRECRLGIQVLPVLPITEVLFSDVGFVRELVKWTLPALGREGVGEGWKGFLYAMEGIYDKEVALEKIGKLSGYDDGNSLTNLLWWIHSRGDEGEGGLEGGKLSWFGQYYQ